MLELLISHSSLDSVQNRLRSLMLYFPLCGIFPRRRHVASLFVTLFFPSKCSAELHSLISPVRIVTARTRPTTSTESNHTHFPCIPMVRRNFYSGSFFLRIPKNSRVDISLNTTILTSLSQRLLVILKIS